MAYLAYLVRGGGGGKRLGRARGDVYSGESRICKKKGWAEISVRVAHRVCAKRTARVSARASYGWGPGARRRAPGGVQGQSPCRGPYGGSPEALEFSANGGGGGLSVLHFLVSSSITPDDHLEFAENSRASGGSAPWKSLITYICIIVFIASFLNFFL